MGSERGVRPVVLESGQEVKTVYGPEDVQQSAGPAGIGAPGEYPFTRGIHALMYRKQPWTMRQYAGFGTAEQTNARFKYLIANGQTGLNVAFDLPNQCGLNCDDPRAAAEVDGGHLHRAAPDAGADRGRRGAGGEGSVMSCNFGESDFAEAALVCLGTLCHPVMSAALVQ